MAILAGVLLVLSCTPLPDDDEEEVVELALDSPSLEPGQEAIALKQLVAALASIELASSRLRSGFQRPDADPTLLESDFADLIGDQIEAARLAELLHLVANLATPRSLAGDAAGEGFAALSTSLYRSAISASKFHDDLDSGATTLTDALAVLDAWQGPSSGGSVVLLPADLGAPLLSLSISTDASTPVLQPATDFGATAAASELAWLEEIAHSSSPADIEGATVAASTRLALINGLSAATPASPFASYALHIPTSHVLYQGDLEQTATLADGAPGLLVLRLSDDQTVEAILLEPGDANASLQVRARGDLRAQNGALPGIGRPDARLVSRGDGYGIAVALEFVNRARVEFAVTCTVPLLGARATTISDGASTAGTLDLAMTTVLALTQVTALEDEPQIVCVDTFGTVETGRIALDEVTAAAVGA